MMKRLLHTIVALVLVVSVLLAPPASTSDDNGIVVQIQPSKDECFYEDIVGVGVKVFLHYMVVSGGALDIEAEVTGPDKSVIWSSPKDTENRVLFKSRQAGSHRFCFSNSMSTLTPKVVAFSVLVADGAGKQEGALRGPATDDDKSNSDPLHKSIMRIQQGMSEIIEIQEYLRVREREHRATTEVANTRVLLFSVLEVVAIVVMCFGNIFYIRKLFTTKRMV